MQVIAETRMLIILLIEIVFSRFEGDRAEGLSPSKRAKHFNSTQFPANPELDYPR